MQDSFSIIFLRRSDYYMFLFKNTFAGTKSKINNKQCYFCDK